MMKNSPAYLMVPTNLWTSAKSHWRRNLTSDKIKAGFYNGKVAVFHADVSGYEPKEPHRQQQGMRISPDGRHLVCCFLGGPIIVYRMEQDGRLTDTGHHGFTKGAGGVSFFDPSL